jgi:hypothetical protein
VLRRSVETALEDWKVENKNAAALEMKAKQEYSAQMEFLRSI